MHADEAAQPRSRRADVVRVRSLRERLAVRVDTADSHWENSGNTLLAATSHEKTPRRAPKRANTPVFEREDSSVTHVPKRVKRASERNYKEVIRLPSRVFAGENAKQLVIRTETDSWPEATADDMGISGNRSFEATWRVVLEDLAAQNRTPKLLTRSFPMQVRYALVSDRTLTSVLGEEGGWRRFYQFYPASGGYFWFSAVGFNPQKSQAIVEFNHGCGPLCGGGQPHFFETIDGKWKEVSVEAQNHDLGVLSCPSFTPLPRAS
jgi:hypothetical protein